MVAPGCGDPGRNACPRTTDIAQLTAQMQLDQGILRASVFLISATHCMFATWFFVSESQGQFCCRPFNVSTVFKNNMFPAFFPIFFVRKSACSSFLAKGEVACDMVEDYLPNGTSLGLVQPSVKCAASYDQCPCRET